MAVDNERDGVARGESIEEKIIKEKSLLQKSLLQSRGSRSRREEFLESGRQPKHSFTRYNESISGLHPE